MAGGEPAPPKVKRRRRSAEQMLGDAESFQSRFKSGKSGSSAPRPPGANDAHADALTLAATGAARAASAAGLLASADDDGAATANPFDTELRGNDLDQALAADAAKSQSHDESYDGSDEGDTMVVTRAASAMVAARAASVTGVLESTATAGARKTETPPPKRRFSVRPELLGNPNVESPARRRPGAAGHSHWTACMDEVTLGLAHHDRGPCPLPVAWLKTREDTGGVLTHERIDTWAELCVESRHHSIFERIHLAFLKRKYGTGVVLRR